MCGFTALRESAVGASRQRRKPAQSRSGAEPLKQNGLEGYGGTRYSCTGLSEKSISVVPNEETALPGGNRGGTANNENCRPCDFSQRRFFIFMRTEITA